MYIECPICSDTSIDKAIMAPRVSSTTRKKGLEYESSINAKAGQDSGSNSNNKSKKIIESLEKNVIPKTKILCEPMLS